MSSAEDAQGGPTNRVGPRRDGDGPLALVVVTAAGVERHPLPPAGPVHIGRGPDATVRIADDSISRAHAVLHVADPILIEDVGSANGTSVRGVALAPHQTVTVTRGDLVELGTVTVFLELADAPGATVARAPTPRRSVDDLDRLVERVAASTISVLLLGETGVGKEVMAETLHRRSKRAKAPFLRLHCAALAETLLESELFGHEKGAFTGAVKAKPGLLEAAGGGTVFLDEVGELPPSIQVKLLRVLEDRRVLRVGSLTPRAIDVRFIAATNRDLDAEVARGAFRRDLYFRLNGIALVLPPLRERRDQIESLAIQLLAEACEREGRSPVPTLSPAVRDRLLAHDFPGNVRELRNLMDRALVLCADDVIRPEHVPLVQLQMESGAAGDVDEGAPARALREDVDEFEKQRVLAALEQCDGHQGEAAKLLGISRRTLVSRLTAWGMTRARTK